MHDIKADFTCIYNKPLEEYDCCSMNSCFKFKYRLETQISNPYSVFTLKMWEVWNRGI